jgi:hypothetical protein
MGMSAAANMSLAQGGMGLMQAGAQMSGARASSSAAMAQNQQEWDERNRQKKEATKNARSLKSDRAREADRLMGNMIATMADNGGSGTATEARFAGEIGYLEGLDMARIEGNRRREIEALSSAQTASSWRALNIISSAGQGAQKAIWNVASTAITNYGRRAGATDPTVTATGTPESGNYVGGMTSTNSKYAPF